MSKLKLRTDFLDSSLNLQERENRIRRFERGDSWILISTDVLARGIDFRDLKTVINYDFPTSQVDYIHRVGRTGRAGKPGKAITFFTEADQGLLSSIAGLMKTSGVEVPAWMLDVTPMNRAHLKRVQKFGIKREGIISNGERDKNRERKRFHREMKRKDYLFHASREVLKKREKPENVEEENGPEEMLKRIEVGDLGDTEFQPVDAKMMAQLGIEVGKISDNESSS